MKQFFSFQWHITDFCDQRCKHCYIYSDNENHYDEMKYSDLIKTFNKCLDFCKYFNREPYFFITGGDPILHKDFWKLLELLKHNNISFSILGNPFHINEENSKKLSELGCDMYQLSLDGLKETHDWFRKPGSFEITLDTIPILQKSGIETNIMTTVSGVNKDELLDIIDIVVKNKADLFAFARFCPGSALESNGLDPFEYRTLLLNCKKKFKEYEDKGVITQFSKKDHLWTLLDYETGDFEIPDGINPDLIYDGCNCGNAHLTLLPNGDIFACRRVNNSKVGNILKDDLIDIWLNKMEDYREFHKFKKCSSCELLAWCRGCPAVASTQKEGFYSSDPQCWK